MKNIWTIAELPRKNSKYIVAIILTDKNLEILANPTINEINNARMALITVNCIVVIVPVMRIG